VKVAKNLTLHVKPLIHLSARSTWYGESEYYSKLITGTEVITISGTLRSRECERVSHSGKPFPQTGTCRSCWNLTKDRGIIGFAEIQAEAAADLESGRPPAHVDLRYADMARADVEEKARRQSIHIRNLERKLAEATQQPAIRNKLARDIQAACAEINPEVSQVLVSLLKAVQTGCIDHTKHGVLISVMKQAVFNLHAKSVKGLRHSKHNQAMMLYEVLLIKGGPWLATFVGNNLLGPMSSNPIKRRWKHQVPYSFGVEGTEQIMPQLAAMYSALMKKLGILAGSIPCEYSENETNVKEEVV
jgi:hypothetical protein